MLSKTSPDQTDPVRSGLAEGLPDGSDHVPPKAVQDVALLQLVVAAAAQETQEARLAGLLAGRRHVALVPEVPEPLEDPVVTLEGPEEAVPVGGEQAGHPVGLRGPVQQGPLGVEVWGQGGGGRGVVGVGEVQDVGLVVQNHTGTAWVVAVHEVDTVAW